MKVLQAVCVSVALLGATAAARADAEGAPDISPFCTVQGVKRVHVVQAPPLGSQEINGVAQSCVTSDGYIRLDYPVSPRAPLLDSDVM